MAVSTYTLDEFVTDLKRITGETSDLREIVSRVRPLTRELALSRTWLAPEHYQAGPEQGFGVKVLHQEPDHTLAVLAASWLPGRGAPPHNHGTWTVVAGVDGLERNVFWQRLDDGSRPGEATIRQKAEKVFGPGDVVTFMPDTIHSVVNDTDQVTVSLHVYGKHPNYTVRSQFDPEAGIEKAFVFRERE
jgi:predicted metal-dependent enzyme (double-stranded beta helix superfamily)